MEKFKKIGKVLLFPHITIMLILLPVAAVFLIYAIIFLNPEAPFAIISYLFAFYTLTVWCARIPELIIFIQKLKNENKYVKRWTGDVRLRMNVSLYGSSIWDVAYAVFQLCLGLYHQSLWYFSISVYYIFIGLMRFYLSRHTRRHNPGEEMLEELKKYRVCGSVFLAMNLALSVMIFFMVYWNRTFNHHEITTIAIAAYTFTKFTFAIINIVKYQRYNSPVFSASKAISLAAACVSMITLASTMLTTFGEADNLLFRRIVIGSLGGAVSVFIIVMAIYMIVKANEGIKKVSFNIVQ